MKKHILISILFLFLAPSLYSQAPQSIPYQAVVRNTDGSVMANTAMTITFKIHDVTATGTVVYEETHSTTTNTQGLVSLNIGAGNPVTGSFSAINWGSGDKFLHVLMNAGSGIVDLGTQQMMSVPYALYAEGVNVRVSNTGDTLYIGNNYSIVPGVSAANPVSISNYGSVLLPGNTTCQNEYISVTGCGGQDSLLYFDRYYSLTEIGGQCWFAENLATDKYASGDSIPTGLNFSQWISTNSGSYSIYNDNEINDGKYGKLYNWYAAVDTRGVCPTGWHVPSDCEWMYLEGSLGMTVAEQEAGTLRGTNEGTKIQATSGWAGSLAVNATNSSGFSALPGGYKNGLDNVNPIYVNILTDAYFWTTTSSWGSSGKWHRRIEGGYPKIFRGNGPSERFGLSIRCIKD